MMHQRELKLSINWILLSVSTVTFSTGLVILICLHMGEGATASNAWGMGRLVWLNIHRLTAIVVVFIVAIHIGLNWPSFSRRFVNLINKKMKKPLNTELILYFAFFISILTSFTAWLVVEDSTPLFGPAVIEPMSHIRHHWIDIHHISSLVSLILIVHHIGHRSKFMVSKARINTNTPKVMSKNSIS